MKPTIPTQFRDSIKQHGTAQIPTEYLGMILTQFQGVGGGNSCIVVIVEDMTVRIVFLNGAWLAERLTIHPGDAA